LSDPQSNGTSDAGLKRFEGAKSSEVSEKITKERIALFCEAVGMKTSLVAPPTFMTVFRKGEFELFDHLGLPFSSVLHSEQQFTYESDLRAGDEILFQTELTSVLEKKGRMSFLHFETSVRVTAPSPRSIGKSKTTIIVRPKGSV
jgi:hypothetical protein